MIDLRQYPLPRAAEEVRVVHHGLFGVAVAIATAVSLLGAFGPAHAQECEDTPEGRICRVQQPITAGALVDTDTQRRLGLVTMATGCSGTLLNRYWVLTARHCVTTTGTRLGPLLPASQVLVTAAWVPSRTGVAKRIHDFAVNTQPGVLPSQDIVLVYLGFADLGPVNSQRIFARARDLGGGLILRSGRLEASDAVTQYGQGLSTLATGVFGGTPPAQIAQGAGVYRSGQFTPSMITDTGYTLAMNASNQVGHGGDSGGPTVVTINGVGAGIAGVQSTCTANGYVANAPIPAGSTSPGWLWATSISACQYVSTDPFWEEIRNAIRETPECPLGPACSLSSIMRYVLD